MPFIERVYVLYSERVLHLRSHCSSSNTHVFVVIVFPLTILVVVDDDLVKPPPPLELENEANLQTK